MDVFLDRWLVCVYSEGLVELWDLRTDVFLHGSHANAQPFRKLHLRESFNRENPCLSTVLSLDEEHSSVILMVVL